jgi:hypothetical protein
MSLFSSFKVANKSTYLLSRSNRGIQRQTPFLFKRGAAGVVIKHDENDPEYEYPEKTSVSNFTNYIFYVRSCRSLL